MQTEVMIMILIVDTLTIVSITLTCSLICLNIGTPKTTNITFGTNGRVIVICVAMLKHIRLCLQIMFCNLFVLVS